MHRPICLFTQIIYNSTYHLTRRRVQFGIHLFGMAIEDTGMIVDVAGTVIQDAGMTTDVAGTITQDTGMTIGDGGMTARDAGTTIDDAGMGIEHIEMTVEKYLVKKVGTAQGQPSLPPRTRPPARVGLRGA